MNDTDFLKQKQDAIARMMSYNGAHPAEKRGVNAPDFIKLFEDKNDNKKDRASSGFSLPFGLDTSGFPFLERLKNDKDSGLILGLILLLICENTDKLTLLALVYIML